jgi:hypothetical protein
MRCAKPSTTAVLPTPAHQNVDDLTNFIVAADDWIHLAAASLCGQVRRELLERLFLAHLGGRHRAAALAGSRAAAYLKSIGGALTILGRSADDFSELILQRLGLDLVELLRHR